MAIWFGAVQQRCRDLFCGERRFDGCDEAWVVGSDLGRDAGYDGTIAAYEELLEVPEDAGLGVGGAAVFAAEEGVQLLAEALAAGTDGLGLGGDERLVERMGVGAGDGDLLEHGEVDAVGAGAEGGDLGVRPGLLDAEVVGGEAEYDESSGFEARVKVFECGVLLGEAALCGDVYDEQDLAAVFGKGGTFAGDAMDRDVINGAGSGGHWAP